MIDFPFWRKCHYTDDGCTLNQCLDCKQKWEGRDDPCYWNYCPFCGIEWVAQLYCRETYTPRWLWDLVGRELEAKDYSTPEAVSRWQAINKHACDIGAHQYQLHCEMELRRGVWVLESMKIGEDRWELEDAFWGHNQTAREALTRMQGDIQMDEIERANSLARMDSDFEDEVFQLDPGMRDRWYPAKTWRKRRMIYSDFKKEFPHKQLY